MTPTLEAAMQSPAYRTEVAHANRRWAHDARKRGDHNMADRILQEIEIQRLNCGGRLTKDDAR